MVAAPVRHLHDSAVDDRNLVASKVTGSSVVCV